LVFGAFKLAGNVQTWTWAVPVADVVAVYRRMGSAFDFVTPEAVTHCLKLLYAGRAAVWSVGDAAVPHFSSHAAFMEQELHEFVYGGCHTSIINSDHSSPSLSPTSRARRVRVNDRGSILSRLAFRLFNSFRMNADYCS
jgi:hypothetical protein